MGVCKYWGGFFYPPNPSQQNHFMHPQPHPKRRKEKEPNKLPHPSFETTPQPPFTKNAHAHAVCSTTHSRSHSLFFSCIYLPHLFLNYLTFDINITQLHLHLHLHFSLFFSLPSSPLSLSLSLSLSLFLLSLSYPLFFSLSSFFGLSPSVNGLGVVA